MFRQVPQENKKTNFPTIINPDSNELEASDLEAIQDIWEKYSKDRPLKANKTYKIINFLNFEQKSYQFTREVKIIEINPLKMKDYQKKYVHSFFEIAGLKAKYSKDKLYMAIVPHHAKSPSVFFRLTHDLLFRQSNPDGKHAGEIRCEVISNEEVVGKGTFGQVIAIDATLAPTEDNKVICKIKPEGKRRVVKVEACEDHDKLRDIQREYLVSKMTDHIRPKEPVIYGNTSFFVMGRMEGKTLLEIIKNDCAGTFVFTALQRIDLCIAILKALEDQVHRHQIIHCDIKTNNILVNMKNDKFDVKIIDYGISDSVHDNKDSSHIASFPYIAPELRAKLLSINSQKCDIYSAARVLSQVFRVDIGFYNQKQFASKLWAEMEDGFLLHGLFEGISDLNDNAKERIRIVLQGLGHSNPEKRWSINEAVVEFESIKSRDLKNSGTKFFSLW